MAGRENQGIQVALIIFVIITVLLSVFTYYFYSQSESARKEVARLTTENQNVGQLRDLYFSKYQHMKFFMGFSDAMTMDQLQAQPRDDDLEAMQKQFDADMVMYGEGLAEENRNYRNLPENLIAAIRTKNVQVADTINRNNALRTERDETVKNESQRTQEAITRQQTAGADLAKERSSFQTARDGFKTKTEADATRIASLAKDLTTTKEAAKVQDDAYKKEINQLETLAQGLKNKLAGLQDESFEVADGKVTWVNQRQNVVWLNLGAGDGLRPQTTFSVYEHDANGVANIRARKGRIEVTRLIDDHLAEARILEDQLSNPILPGDKIHTPAWQPGRRLRFAIAGILDVDNDEKTDPAVIKRIISMNGGKLDLELKPNGDVAGELSVDTRYLVLGKPPVSNTGEVDENILATYTEILGNAQRLGVEQISIDKFLNFMGWRSGSRTVPLGRFLGSGATPANYDKAPTGAGAGEGGNDDAFKPRKAPARGDDGAF